MPVSHKPQLQLDQESTRELNLTVLQRIDPFIEEVLITAGHVTLYEFNLDEQAWGRKDVEGSLFVVKRREQPRFQFVVMNRRSTENLVENLLGDFEFELQLPYLLYRNGEQQVNGIWFYNARECDDVAKLFTRILNAFSKAPPKPKVFAAPSAEFQELEAVPTAATVEGPLEMPVAPTSAADLLQFFGNPLDVASIPGPASVPHPIPSAMSSDQPMAPPSSSHATLPPSAPPTSSMDLSELGSHIGLLKPDFFGAPAHSASPHMTQKGPLSLPPEAESTVPIQASHGAPFLQPFPPPAPSHSLAPVHGPHEVVVTRDSIRSALLRLVQDDRFIDLVYGEIVAEQQFHG